MNTLNASQLLLLLQSYHDLNLVLAVIEEDPEIPKILAFHLSAAAGHLGKLLQTEKEKQNFLLKDNSTIRAKRFYEN